MPYNGAYGKYVLLLFYGIGDRPYKNAPAFQGEGMRAQGTCVARHQQGQMPRHGQRHYALAGATNTSDVETPAFLYSLDLLFLLHQGKRKENKNKKKENCQSNTGIILLLWLILSKGWSQQYITSTDRICEFSISSKLAILISLKISSKKY